MPTRTRKIKAAIAYDFDGTLAPGNMQERDFIPELGLKPKAFWKQVKQLAAGNDMDEVLAYLNLMLRRANERGVRINKASFERLGRQLRLFPGVRSWFGRINRFAESRDVLVEHYIISSGLREMIAGSAICHQFKAIFASGFCYDQHDVAYWPALAVNYTTKTQYLFRINKRILNSFDNTTINKYCAEADRPIPFDRMIYLGDGDTDVPAMKMVTHKGGYAIAVYEKRKRGAATRARELIREDRAAAAVVADFRGGQKLELLVRGRIDLIAAASRLSAITR